MRFENHGDLSYELATAAMDWIESNTDATSVVVRMSNKSASSYVYVNWEDEDGEYVREVKISFTDHNGGNHEEQHTVRFEQIIEAIEDDGEYSHIEISQEDFDSLVHEAVSVI